LFIELGADEKYLDSPFIFASAKDGYASSDIDEKREDMEDLFKTIVEYIPAPLVDADEPLQILISTIDYNDYVGRIGIGKIQRSKIRANQEAIIVNKEKPGHEDKIKITNIYEFEGLDRVKIDQSSAGSIIAVTGVEGIQIGDTICDEEHPESLPFVKISEP